MKPIVNLYKLGRLPYVKALNVQQVLFNKSKQTIITSKEKSNSLIILEHEPVYTIGIRSKTYNDDYVSKLRRKLFEKNLKADFVKTTRGGLITFHGPGQLVAYPIIYLGDFTRTIKDRSLKSYVKLLETTIIDTLASVGVHGAHTVDEYPGVWLDGGERKIAFIGITCKRYVTMHGISINCDCDLSWFDHIVSCGIENKKITSIHQELNNVNIQPNNRLPNPLSTQVAEVEGMNSNNINCSKSNVEYIAENFCLAFSRNFDCILREECKLIDF